VQDGEGIDLLHEVADVHRSGGRAALLHLVAQGSQIVGGNFVQLPVLEGGKMSRSTMLLRIAFVPATSTADLFRWPAIAIDRYRDASLENQYVTAVFR